MNVRESEFRFPRHACLVFCFSCLVACNGLGAPKPPPGPKSSESLNGGNESGNVIVDGTIHAGSLELSGDLTVSGTTRTGVLTITGGADIAEPFPIGGSIPVQPGQVVIIDDQTPGMLRISDQAYDTRVAGVIAGAGDLQPGLKLARTVPRDGEHFVALGGLVFVIADATTDEIRSGDLLTSSDRSGHAMKVRDRNRADGAIIGKAMSSLHDGQGLVLMLVNLL